MKFTTRLLIGLRLFGIVFLLLAAVAVLDRVLSWPLLTTTLGPTAYVFAAHPHSETARMRNAIVGHGVAIGLGVGALAVFGISRAQSLDLAHPPSIEQLAAAIVSVAATMFVLELLSCHHAPAAASALLVSTGLAKPGEPLIGLVLGLVVVIVLGPLLGRWGFVARATEKEMR